jgi:hypothetical protein
MRSRKTQNPKLKTPQKSARGRHVPTAGAFLWIKCDKQSKEDGPSCHFLSIGPNTSWLQLPNRLGVWNGREGWHTSCCTRHWLHSGEVRMLIRAARSRRGLTSTGQSGYRRLKAERMREYLARKSTWRESYFLAAFQPLECAESGAQSREGMVGGYPT